MFHATQNNEYMQNIVARVKNEYLVWVEQFLDIIDAHNFTTNHTLNDIGCNVGQFYKGLLRRSFNIEYHGFDIEKLYIDKAIEIFPELHGHVQKLDITRERPNTADITIISATLEHLDSLQNAFKNVLQSTNKLCIIRTFLGNQFKRAEHTKQGASRPYLINQFSFEEICEIISSYNFSTNILRDKYTDSMPKYIAPGIIRTQYIIVGRKND